MACHYCVEFALELVVVPARSHQVSFTSGEAPMAERVFCECTTDPHVRAEELQSIILVSRSQPVEQAGLGEDTGEPRWSGIFKFRVRGTREHRRGKPFERVRRTHRRVRHLGH